MADIEHRRLQPVLYDCRDMSTVTNYFRETGQEKDSIELVEARNMALATEGIYATITTLVEKGDVETLESVAIHFDF